MTTTPEVAPVAPVAPAAVPRAPWVGHAAAAGLVGAASGGCVWGATTVSTSPTVHSVALFVHLAALVVGFGAVLCVDWVALLWVLGRRRIEDVLAVATSLSVPIWLGYAGLVTSGVLLDPDVASSWTRVKLLLVVVIGVNGVFAAWIHRLMDAHPTRTAVTLGAGCAGLSQVSWWAATLVGYVNAH